MKGKLRKSGIDILGEVPWGAHFCLFYQTKEDLIDILVPYFKAGLENNEFCLWITSKPLGEKEAKKAMKKAVPDFDQYLKRGQIEIIPHTQWYLIDGVFNLKRVLKAWADKFNQVLIKDYEGIRITGNTAWLEKRDWKNFADYEEEVNKTIGKYRVIALCTYPLNKCGAAEIIDVVSNHRCALIKRQGEWGLIESSGRKRAEKELRESEERFRAVAESATDAIISIDNQGKVIFWNKAAEKIFGYTARETIGKPLTLIMPKQFRQAHHKGIEHVVSTGKTNIVGKTVEMVGLRKDGSEFPTELSLATWKTKEEVFFTSIIRDITERKQAEEKLKKAKASVERKVKEATYQLKKQHQAQQNFFIDLAHELKTPLTIMQGSLDLASEKRAEKIRQDPKSFARFLVAQKEEAERIDKIINDLSTLAKAETNQFTLRFKKLKLNKLIKKVCAQFKTLATQQEKRLIVKKLTSLTIRGDQQRLEHLVTNLLDNAIKFTKPKSGRIYVSLTKDGGQAKIKIKDNGIGIPKKDLPYIFKRFYRNANVNRHPELRDSGLGLAICQWIVREHQGKITVKSVRGKGTVFTIFLPLSH